MPFKHFAECFILKRFVSEPSRTLGVRLSFASKRMPPSGREGDRDSGGRSLRVRLKSTCFMASIYNNIFLSKISKIFPFNIDNTRKKRYNIDWIFMITNRKEK